MMSNDALYWADSDGLYHPDSSVTGEKPLVGVLLSTYNGAEYLVEQLDSIASQQGVRIVLYIRDDGSIDQTAEVLNKWLLSSSNRIADAHISYGANLGYFRSFQALLMESGGCDYYAFADQDDVWAINKLISAIDLMRLQEGACDLYASCVEIADERLAPVAMNRFRGLTFTLRSELIRHRLAGHTMLWDNRLHVYMSRLGPLACWSHDQYVSIACLLSGGSLVMDRRSYVLHRRPSTSVTPGGRGILKRIRHEAKLVLNEHHVMDRAKLGSEILAAVDQTCISEKDWSFLSRCSHYRDNLARRVGFALSPDVNCGLAIGDLEARMSILMGRF